jgi:hypothetical protein
MLIPFFLNRLIDAGKCEAALHYIEELSKVIATHALSIEADLIDSKSLFNQLLQIAEHLKYMDPMYATGKEKATEQIK